MSLESQQRSMASDEVSLLFVSQYIYKIGHSHGG
jgi:hypothetical protein